MSSEKLQVCVIIAAYNAEATIGRAIASALAEPEVVEVVIVDDCSTDSTLFAAEAASSASPRVSIIAQSENVGPAAARNRAIEASNAPFIAILDADDYFLPGRFQQMGIAGSWDVLADNIAFVPEALVQSVELEFVPSHATFRQLNVDEFIHRNISRPGQTRGEIAFMKPVLSRDFLDRNGLRYDQSLRLGEDYAFYLRLLLARASFGISQSCGYVAVERASSLSGAHRTADLHALLESDKALLRTKTLSTIERKAIRRHATHISARYHHRYILDIRRRWGRFGAACAAISSPKRLPALLAAVARDKLGRPLPQAKGVRYLFD